MLLFKSACSRAARRRGVRGTRCKYCSARPRRACAGRHRRRHPRPASTAVRLSSSPFVDVLPGPYLHIGPRQLEQLGCGWREHQLCRVTFCNRLELPHAKLSARSSTWPAGNHDRGPQRSEPWRRMCSPAGVAICRCRLARARVRACDSGRFRRPAEDSCNAFALSMLFRAFAKLGDRGDVELWGALCDAAADRTAERSRRCWVGLRWIERPGVPSRFRRARVGNVCAEPWGPRTLPRWLSLLGWGAA